MQLERHLRSNVGFVTSHFYYMCPHKLRSSLFWYSKRIFSMGWVYWCLLQLLHYHSSHLPKLKYNKFWCIKKILNATQKWSRLVALDLYAIKFSGIINPEKGSMTTLPFDKHFPTDHQNQPSNTEFILTWTPPGLLLDNVKFWEISLYFCWKTNKIYQKKFSKLVF